MTTMTPRPIIIGIAGPSASGKSLLAKTILKELGSNQVIVISQDCYYKDLSMLPFEERTKINFDHPDAFDFDLMEQQLLQMRANETVEIPVYSHSEYIRSQETRPVGPHTIIVLEGILLFQNPKVRELLDTKIFIDTSLDICLVRRARRDVIERQRTFESVLDQYERTVRPMYLQFIEPSKRYADIIVPRGGENRIAIDLIKAKMREFLRDRVAS